MDLNGPTDRRLRAVLARDDLADGEFVYGVRSTGIYCRPSCPSRRPKPGNLVFFDGHDAAAAAGFRACLRCRPDRVSAEQVAVAKVRALVDGSEARPSLADLGASVGMSPYHLQRLFKRRTGLTPKEYGQAVRAARIERSLDDGVPVASALYEGGYGSSRGLYQAGPRDLGMTPARRAAGGATVTVRYGTFDTRLGRALVAATDRGIAALHFGDRDEALLSAVRGELPRAELVHDEGAVRVHVEAIERYLAGDGRAVRVSLDVGGTEFQRLVWEELRRIPYGETRSYQDVAIALARPTAARAVARACATNPVALFIPCHRVVRRGSARSGYRWGVERKRRVLELESEA